MPDVFVEDINATPNKQVLMSISKDIDLYRGICEMIDNRLGFKPGLLGRPHTTVAWFKGIIRLNGKNRFMPWNSSKSNLDPLNPTYDKLIEKLLTT